MGFQGLLIVPLKKLTRKFKGAASKPRRICGGSGDANGIETPSYIAKPQSSPTSVATQRLPTFASTKLRHAPRYPQIPPRTSSLPSHIVVRSTKLRASARSAVAIDEAREILTDQKAELVLYSAKEDVIGADKIRFPYSLSARITSNAFLPTVLAIESRDGDHITKDQTRTRIHQTLQKLPNHDRKAFLCNDVLFVANPFPLSPSLKLDYQTNSSSNFSGLAGGVFCKSDNINALTVASVLAQLEPILVQAQSSCLTQLKDSQHELSQNKNHLEYQQTYKKRLSRTFLAQIADYRFRAMVAIREATMAILKLQEQKRKGI